MSNDYYTIALSFANWYILSAEVGNPQKRILCGFKREICHNVKENGLLLVLFNVTINTRDISAAENVVK